MLSGSVHAGPTCPVESATHPCPSRPLSGALVVAEAAGRLTSQVRTGRDGSFTLTIPAGRYTVEVRTPGPLPRCNPVTVTVAANTHRHLSITCDTGIR